MCFEDMEAPTNPCACTGDMRFACRGCLTRWISKRNFTCAACKTEFEGFDELIQSVRERADRGFRGSGAFDDVPDSMDYMRWQYIGADILEPGGGIAEEVPEEVLEGPYRLMLPELLNNVFENLLFWIDGRFERQEHQSLVGGLRERAMPTMMLHRRDRETSPAFLLGDVSARLLDLSDAPRMTAAVREHGTHVPDGHMIVYDSVHDCLRALPTEVFEQEVVELIAAIDAQTGGRYSGQDNGGTPSDGERSAPDPPVHVDAAFGLTNMEVRMRNQHRLNQWRIRQGMTHNSLPPLRVRDPRPVSGSSIGSVLPRVSQGTLHREGEAPRVVELSMTMPPDASTQNGLGDSYTNPHMQQNFYAEQHILTDMFRRVRHHSYQNIYGFTVADPPEAARPPQNRAERRAAQRNQAFVSTAERDRRREQRRRNHRQ